MQRTKEDGLRIIGSQNLVNRDSWACNWRCISCVMSPCVFSSWAALPAQPLPPPIAQRFFTCFGRLQSPLSRPVGRATMWRGELRTAPGRGYGQAWWLSEVKQPRWWLMLTTQLHATFAVRWWRTYSDVTFMTLQEWDTERRRGEIMSSITLPFWDKINQTLFSYLLNKCQVSLLASRRRKRKGGWCKLCVPLAY